MSIRASLLTVAASLCMLPAIQADIVKATPLSTVSFRFGAFEGGGETCGVSVEGFGVFNVPTGLTNVTTADVTNFNYIEYFDISNCVTESCYDQYPPYNKVQNFAVDFTLTDLNLTLDKSGNIATFEADATGIGPNQYQTTREYPFSVFYQENGLNESFQDVGFGYAAGGITEINIISATPEPAFIGLFAGGLVLAGLAAKRASMPN